MKTYVLTVSEYFPANHNRAGDPTFFIKSIAHKIKKHTLRGNYELWKKRFEKIEAGEARLSVRVWTGKPYKSNQQEAFSFDRTGGIGIQKLEWSLLGWFIDGVDNDLTTEQLAKNDGLSNGDFKDWFKNYDLTKPLAIIHFTNFRY